MPYTITTMDEPNARRQTPSWLKMIYAVLITVLLITIAGLIFAPQHSASQETPGCTTSQHRE